MKGERGHHAGAGQRWVLSEDEMERFRLVVDAAPNGILLVDDRGEIILINANAEKMFAYDAGELVGVQMSVLLPQRYQENHGAQQQSFFARPEVRPMGDGRELHAARKGGEEFPVEIGLQPILTEGQRKMALAVVVDITQRKRLQEQRREMEQRVLEINENEQRRLGREIHDDLCQQLAAIGCLAKVVEMDLRRLDFSAAEALAEIVDLVSQANVRAREISRGSAAAVLDVDGLPGALKELADLTGKGANVLCVLDCKEGESSGSVTVDLQLYRIAQEAVNNALRHGLADEIVLRLLCSGDELELVVLDNGCGIKEQQLNDRSGMGLRTMSYRAEASGGHLQVRRRASTGTEVRCRVPLVLK
ncbi:MAG: PAS domain S-box protein [Verrucomicrobiales bacterium]|nr:PAS domain S-box protein [Verrucomicrobiales bacterium]